MKKILNLIIFIIILFLLSLIIVLSTIGIETDRLNSLISKQINQANKKITLNLDTIVYRLDIKNFSLFLETRNPNLIYRGASIPTKNIRVYINFISIIKTDPKIKKINIVLNELTVKDLKSFNNVIKPSNLKSFMNNKIDEGNINAEIEVFLDDNNLIDNFIAKGSVKKLKADLIKQLSIDNTEFNFFADSTDILIKNISGDTNYFKVFDGDLRISLFPEVLIDSNFKSDFNYLKDIKNKDLYKDFKYIKKITKLEAKLNNTFFINLDKTYKIKEYKFKSTGKVLNIDLKFENGFKNLFLSEEIKSLNLKDAKVISNFSSTQRSLNLSGKYKINNSNFLDFNFENLVKDKNSNVKLNFDYSNSLSLNAINYQKPKDKNANVDVNFNQKNGNIKINKLIFKESDNQITLEGVKLKKNKFTTLKKIIVKTVKNGKPNNNFRINFGKKILIKGDAFDANQLLKQFSNKNGESFFSNINKDIEIEFDEISAPLSSKLTNFKLIGRIENGEFVKISSKGDYGNNKFLDITMKNDKKTKKKYLEIYSDLTEPLLIQYNFFKGLSGGNLNFTSIIDKKTSNSKLKIENFKVINATGMIKLLSLADLSGLADLAAGDGISFDILEINFEKKENLIKLNEILALGPSMSVLMEGYQDSSTTSLRGTLIPAKTLNKMISKIPVIGDIVIPKEVGEGLFGISFKMKGPPGEIKTTINPIKTLTPRFIQKVLDKNKNTK